MSSIKETIKAEIERLYYGEAPKHDQQCEFEDGYFTGIATISKFIDSLPEESKVDVTDFCKPIDPSIAQCIADNFWEMLGEEEKPSEDLEKELNKYIDDTFTVDDGVASIPREERHYYLEEDDMIAIARHFAEWQKSRLTVEDIKTILDISFWNDDPEKILEEYNRIK